MNTDMIALEAQFQRLEDELAAKDATIARNLARELDYYREFVAELEKTERELAAARVEIKKLRDFMQGIDESLNGQTPVWSTKYLKLLGETK